MSDNELRMSQERYIEALKRQRDRIASGIGFEAVDSEVIGDKYTHASWGLCSIDKAAWPDKEDHLWPDLFETSGRIAPKYRNDNQPCPMQKEGGRYGCFHSCRIFQTAEINANTREKAIDLYDEMLEKLTSCSNKK